MSVIMEPVDCTEKDNRLTRANREKLLRNRNLLLWYEKLYMRQFGFCDNIDSGKILEIGSGTSPLKLFHPHVLTSDILELDYLDYIFDCHDIDIFEPIPNESLDVITMTNVLHHLKAPVTFLIKAAQKLKPGGKVIMAEPYFSAFSRLIYTHIHPEPVNFYVNDPVLCEVRGPLTSANIALPYQIFFSDKKWSEPLVSYYDFSIESVSHYSSLAYMLTGGISMRFPVPASIYRLLLGADIFMADRFPKVFSSFFILVMAKRVR
jgi:SAM-dependent methyltransferase